MSAYDPTNIFARILAGDIPSHKVFEDDHVLSFMDVNPQSKGHTLVIPKTGSRNILDADPDVLAQTITRVQTIAKAVKEALNADGIRVVQFNEEVAGQSVFHLHFHVIPVYQGVALKPHTGEMADNAELAEQAKQIVAAL